MGQKKRRSNQKLLRKQIDNKIFADEGLYRFATTSASTLPSTPPYPIRTTSSHIDPSRAFAAMLLHCFVPNASFPSSGPSSIIAFRSVRYKLQTFILELRLASAIGAARSSCSCPSLSPCGISSSSDGFGGVRIGSRVESASANRRVRKKSEACL